MDGGSTISLLLASNCQWSWKCHNRPKTVFQFYSRTLLLRQECLRLISFKRITRVCFWFSEATCRVLSIAEGIDAQTNDLQFVREGFEVPAQTLMIFTCVKERINVIGPDVVTCLPSGTWSGPYPTECGKHYSSQTTTDNIRVLWSDLLQTLTQNKSEQTLARQYWVIAFKAETDITKMICFCILIFQTRTASTLTLSIEQCFIIGILWVSKLPISLNLPLVNIYKTKKVIAKRFSLKGITTLS